MKLQVPKDFNGNVQLNGQSFEVDSFGQVEIPDEWVGHRFYEQGFTVAVKPVVKKPSADTE
jgi:hypothetical protein